MVDRQNGRGRLWVDRLNGVMTHDLKEKKRKRKKKQLQVCGPTKLG